MSDDGKVVHLDKIRGYWFHDPSIPQAEIDVFNYAFALAAREDPRWAKLIWHRPKKRKGQK
jgi:hypothetical protein